MSGTSLDGVDGVLLAIHADTSTHFEQRAFASYGIPPDLRAELLTLNTAGDNELHRAALAANALTHLYAQVVAALCQQANIAAEHIHIIGAHGQTVRHQPQQFDDTGYTIQLINGALLAELTGVKVACDFRNRDLAAGGQGAPLVPAFHHALWGGSPHTLAVLNIGGIANLTVLAPKQAPVGFDCGTGNVLLDYWCQQHTQHSYDKNGDWAQQGQVHQPLLQQMLQDDFVQQAPPKSTGRDYFHPRWLQQQLDNFQNIAAVDVQATLTAFTAQAAAQQLLQHAPNTQQLLVCGGGAHNAQIMQHLQHALSNVQVQTTAAVSIAPLAVEASAFAWLASKTLLGQAVDLTHTTGAHTARVAGCLYWA